MKCNQTRISLIIAATLTVTALTGEARAEDPIGGAPGDWLSRYAGARSTGLGGAYVANAQDPLGMVWNPAGMNQLFQNEVSLETVRLFESTSINSLGFVVPGSRLPSFGFAMLQLKSGNFERTTDLNEPIGSFEESDTAFLFSLAKTVSPRFALGTTVKVVRQTVEEFNAGGVGLDLGATVNITPKLRLGASVLNLGGPSLSLREVEESFPTELRSGLALRVLGGRGIVAAEIDHRSGFDTSLHAGTEVWVHPTVALRLGYDDAYAAGGLSYRLPDGWRFDYGVADHDLGVTHRLGLSYRFGGFFAQSQASPEVFSPTGQQSVTKFHLKTRTKAAAKSWDMKIYDKSDELVRQFGGPDVPPAHILWDGKNEAGLPLPDGMYRYVLRVMDAEGHEVVSRERAVEITTSGPQGSISVD